MLAKQPSCNESATQPRILVSTTTIIRTWWVFIELKMNSGSDFSTSLNLPQRYTTYYWYLLVCLTLPISARNSRYQSAVRIQEQPRICLSRFSRIWDRWREATAGSPVIFGEESKVDRCRLSAACYLVSFAISSAHILGTDGQFCVERFCIVLNNARPLLPLETEFFETARAGKG